MAPGEAGDPRIRPGVVGCGQASSASIGCGARGRLRWVTADLAGSMAGADRGRRCRTSPGVERGRASLGVTGAAVVAGLAGVAPDLAGKEKAQEPKGDGRRGRKAKRRSRAGEGGGGAAL